MRFGGQRAGSAGGHGVCQLLSPPAAGRNFKADFRPGGDPAEGNRSARQACGLGRLLAARDASGTYGPSWRSAMMLAPGMMVKQDNSRGSVNELGPVELDAAATPGVSAPVAKTVGTEITSHRPMMLADQSKPT